MSSVSLVLPFLGGALAGFAEMEAAYNTLVTQANTIMRARGPNSDKNVAPPLGTNFANIDQYGCWCYFHPNGTIQGDFGDRRGRGVPVNSLDEECRKLTWGYDCIIMDAEENGWTMETSLTAGRNGDPCVPWDVSYTSGIAGGIANVVANCELGNNAGTPGTECAVEACKVESYFVMNLFNEIGQGIDNQFKEENGWENNQDNCPTIAGLGPMNRECCGAYPYRRPFRPRTDENTGVSSYACCTDEDTQTYIIATNRAQCCNAANEVFGVMPVGDICETV